MIPARRLLSHPARIFFAVSPPVRRLPFLSTAVIPPRVCYPIRRLPFLSALADVALISLTF